MRRMMPWNNGVIASFVFLLLAPIPTPANSQEQAIVYVWKTWHINTLRRITFDVYLDAKPIARLDRNRYFVALVTPGTHVFSTKTRSASGVDLNFEAGHSYYLRMDTSNGMTVGHPVLSHVSEEEGQAAIRQAQRINPTDVLDGSVVSLNYEPTVVSSKHELSSGRGNSDEVSFHVTSEPEGADIFIDGEFKGATPSQLKAVSGSHVLKISRPGFAEWQRTIVLESGTAVSFNGILLKAAQ